MFEGPGLKTYRFAAVDRQSQESWEKALLSASHCYLSLLMKDLGRQYEGVLTEIFVILNYELDVVCSITVKVVVWSL